MANAFLLYQDHDRPTPLLHRKFYNFPVNSEGGFVCILCAYRPNSEVTQAPSVGLAPVQLLSGKVFVNGKIKTFLLLEFAPDSKAFGS